MILAPLMLGESRITDSNEGVIIVSENKKVIISKGIPHKEYGKEKRTIYLKYYKHYDPMSMSEGMYGVYDTGKGKHEDDRLISYGANVGSARRQANKYSQQIGLSVEARKPKTYKEKLAKRVDAREERVKRFHEYENKVLRERGKGKDTSPISGNRAVEYTRNLIREDIKKGLSTSEIASKYHISTTYAWRIKNNQFK